MVIDERPVGLEVRAVLQNLIASVPIESGGRIRRVISWLGSIPCWVVSVIFESAIVKTLSFGPVHDFVNCYGDRTCSTAAVCLYECGSRTRRHGAPPR
jgi:hypothetical protein